MSVTGLMNQSLPIKARNSIDGFGESGFAAAVTVDARVEPMIENVIDSTGKTRITSFRIFVGPSITVSPGDVVTWDGTDWEVIKVGSIYKGSGVLSHKEVFV